MRRITPGSVPVVLTAVVTAVVAVLAAAAPSSAAEKPPLRYVAMGDSYSAASGVLLPDLSSPLCLRSTRNYPKLVARAIGARLTDVTCGAARTVDFFAPQYPFLVPPQLNALKPDTELVTMTIGGNDSGVFINAILSCGTSGVVSLGQGSPCQDLYGSRFSDAIEDTPISDDPGCMTSMQARDAMKWGRRLSSNCASQCQRGKSSNAKLPWCSEPPALVTHVSRRP